VRVADATTKGKCLSALEELAKSSPGAADANVDSLTDVRFVDEIRQSGLVERLCGR
jgi:hypothetical protein